MVARESLREPDTAEKSALLARDGDDFRSEAADQIGPLATHPVGHEDHHRVSERAADGGERDAGVAARASAMVSPSRMAPVS